VCVRSAGLRLPVDAPRQVLQVPVYNLPPLLELSDTATQAEDLGGEGGDQGDREDERDEGHPGGLARGGLRHQQRRHSPPTPHTPVRHRPRAAM
jgi:hypothetical protein